MVTPKKMFEISLLFLFIDITFFFAISPEKYAVQLYIQTEKNVYFHRTIAKIDRKTNRYFPFWLLIHTFGDSINFIIFPINNQNGVWKNNRKICAKYLLILFVCIWFEKLCLSINEKHHKFPIMSNKQIK